MHKIDKDIIDALNRLIDDCGAALEVERRTGVTNSTLFKYLLSGGVTSEEIETFRKTMLVK